MEHVKSDERDILPLLDVVCTDFSVHASCLRLSYTVWIDRRPWLFVKHL